MVISSTRIVCLVAALAVVGCGGGYYSRIDDEALQRGHKAADYLPKKIDNYFKGMDGVIVPPPNMAYQLLDKAPALATSHTPLADPVATESEMFGRNTWMIWVGGNDG